MNLCVCMQLEALTGSVSSETRSDSDVLTTVKPALVTNGSDRTHKVKEGEGKGKGKKRREPPPSSASSGSPKRQKASTSTGKHKGSPRVIYLALSAWSCILTASVVASVTLLRATLLLFLGGVLLWL